MSKVTVLFFAADPLSAPPGGTPRLLLDEDVRQIQQKVRAAEYRDQVEFDVRWATRTDDLLQALNETRAQVVHFSGHGGSEGLVLVGTDGEPHAVSAAALARLFEVFRGDVRVVVLNACFSLPQAQAIANTVGCAIGTRGEISDEAAITFGSSFYRAIAFGRSVRDAFDQASAALKLEHVHESEFPELITRPGVDPAKLILVSGDADEPARMLDRAPRDPFPPRSHIPAHEDAVPHHPSRPDPTRRHDAAARHDGRAAPASRRRWIFPAVVWLAAFGGAFALVDGPAEALVLSLLPLYIACVSLRFTPSPGRAVNAVPAGIALVLSVGSVLAGANLLRQAPDESAPIRPVMGGVPAPGAGSPAVQPADSSSASRVSSKTGSPDTSGASAAPPRDSVDVESELSEAKELYRGMNYSAAHPIFQRTAAAGNTEAMGFLGIMYLIGLGTAKRPDLAIPWLRRAAAAGDARGMNALGVAYVNGEGVDRSYQEGMRWYQASQEKGYAEAMSNIGSVYRYGWGVDRDYELAVRWYRTAANAGSPDGMSNLGTMYEQGFGVGRDLDEAARWYGIAADAGSLQGMYNLARMYENGTGLARDYGQARAWYLKAANAGYVEAMNSIGLLHHYGRGVRRDREEAIRWFRRAAEAGSPHAAGNLEALGVT